MSKSVQIVFRRPEPENVFFIEKMLIAKVKREPSHIFIRFTVIVILPDYVVREHRMRVDRFALIDGGGGDPSAAFDANANPDGLLTSPFAPVCQLFIFW